MDVANGNARRMQNRQQRWRSDPLNREKERAAGKRYRKAHPERATAYRIANRARDAIWRATNRARLLANGKAYRSRPEVKMQKRENNRRLSGKPTPTRPESMLCECCGHPPGKKALAVDHCHLSGIFRGWLCVKCNTGIGALGDLPEGLRKALDYLERAYVR